MGLYWAVRRRKLCPGVPAGGPHFCVAAKCDETSLTINTTWAMKGDVFTWAKLHTKAGGISLADPFQALAMQEPLQSRYTGGTVLHLYMSEQVSSVEACKRLVRRALTNFRLPYITVTPVFSICPKHGYLAGEHEFCPVCDQEVIARKQAAGEGTPANERQ